nr:hypothetical protein [Tanacetum cinerariifolium]
RGVTPTVESTSGEGQNKNSTTAENGESTDSILSKPVVKFVKADKVEIAKKPAVRYAEMYRRTSKRKMVQRETTRSQNHAYKSPPLRPAGHRPHGPPMRPSHRHAGHRPHGPPMRPQYRALWVQRETTRSQNHAYIRSPHRSGGHRPHGAPMRPPHRFAGHRPHGTLMRPPHRSAGHKPHGAPIRPSHRPAGHRPHGPSTNPMRPNMN